MPKVKSEHSPLSRLDAYPVHQFMQPIRVMWSSDARTYERYWFAIHDQAGELLIIQGCGFYPSLDTAEAYSIVVHRGMHTTVRHFRRLGDDRLDLRLGPINLEVIEPFREIRLTLAENPQGTSYDLRFKDTVRAVFSAGPQMSTDGRLRDQTGGYESFGTVEGWVNYKGTTISLGPGDCTGTRDHHWGTRNGVGGPAYYAPPVLPPGQPTIYGDPGHGVQFQEFKLKDIAFWIHRTLYPIGDPRPGEGPRILDRKARLRFDPVSHALLEGTVDYRLNDGQKKQAYFKRMGDQTACLRCGMYPQGGGTPDRGLWQGMYGGDEVTEGETFDLRDPRVLARLNGLHDNQVMVTCDGETVMGLFETISPTLHEFCALGMPGYSLYE